MYTYTHWSQLKHAINTTKSPSPKKVHKTQIQKNLRRVINYLEHVKKNGLFLNIINSIKESKNAPKLPFILQPPLPVYKAMLYLWQVHFFLFDCFSFWSFSRLENCFLSTFDSPFSMFSQHSDFIFITSRTSMSPFLMTLESTAS